MSRPVSSSTPRSAVRQPGAKVFQPNRVVGVRGRGHYGQAAVAQHAAGHGRRRADHADRATADHSVRGEAGTDEEEPAEPGAGGDEALVTGELLVEEISIDGMCGVY